MIEHFRVAYRFEGVRREVVVHLYSSRDDFTKAAEAYSGESMLEADGLFHPYGYSFNEGEVKATPGPLGVVLIHRDRLTVEVIAHEMTHAAMHQYFSVVACNPTEEVDEHLHGGNEAVAYFVGAWTSQVVSELHDRGYSVSTR